MDLLDAPTTIDGFKFQIEVLCVLCSVRLVIVVIVCGSD